MEVGWLQTVLAEHRQSVLLIGAGASISSGVPAAGETVNRAAKWAYCKAHGRSTMDPGVVDSDWVPWMEGQTWFSPGISLADQYPEAIDHLLGISNDKREFFEQLISRGVQPREGYRALARILNNGEHVPEKCGRFSDKNRLKLKGLEPVPEKCGRFSDKNRLRLKGIEPVPENRGRFSPKLL